MVLSKFLEKQMLLIDSNFAKSLKFTQRAMMIFFLKSGRLSQVSDD